MLRRTLINVLFVRFERFESSVTLSVSVRNNAEVWGSGRRQKNFQGRPTKKDRKIVKKTEK